MKVEKKNEILLFSWLPTGTDHKEKLQNLANLGHFFHEKSFV
jgi:hypothetical protein